MRNVGDDVVKYIFNRAINTLKREEGQSVTEFAIVLPVLLLIVLGALIIGAFIYTKLVVVLAASQGARVGGAVYNDTTLTDSERITKIEDTAMTIVSNGLSGSDRSVNVTKLTDEVQVTVKYDFKMILPMLKPFFNNQSTFEVEYTSIYATFN